MNNQSTLRVLRRALPQTHGMNTAKLVLRTNSQPRPSILLQWARYSSLRNGRKLGPRGRIRQHLEKPAAYQHMSQTIDNNNSTSTTTTTATDTPSSSELIQQPNPEFTDPALAVVHIPQASDAVVTSTYAGAPVLSQSALVVGRELEMLNVFLGYEQANKYKIMDPNGNLTGYILEEEGFAKSLSRQFLRTHRQLNATVMDAQGNVVFKIHRPLSLINSRIFISTSDDQVIGEVQQRWHLLRRKYDLFTGTNQFASIDTPFLGWDFDLKNQEGTAIANVSRNFVGFAREIFTDSGQYVIRMDAMEGSQGLTLDQRSVMLACAISIDFDFFSRHSSHGAGGFFPIPFFGGGGTNETSRNDEGNENPSGPNIDVPPPAFGQQEEQQQQSNEYGDVWMDDEQAGVSSPEDDSWIDVVSDFLRPPE